MNKLLKIQVETPDHVKAGEFKTLFLNTIEVDDSINFDFRSALKGLQVLFPNKHLIINLTLM